MAWVRTSGFGKQRLTAVTAHTTCSTEAAELPAAARAETLRAISTGKIHNEARAAPTTIRTRISRPRSGPLIRGRNRF